MKWFLWSLFMGVQTLTCLAFFVPEPQASTKNLDSLVLARMKQTKVPGLALARIEQGRLAWIRVYGEASPGRPVTAQTPFNVASLTKPVFATLVLQLVAKSQFALDAPLAPLWMDPDLVDDPRAQKITARMALSHQTGLPNWRAGRKLAFQFDPGQGTDYSGEGYEYLRRALQKATGKKLPDLMMALQKKANMPSASFGWSDALVDQLAVGYDEDAKPLSIDYLKERGPAAASSLFCSIQDYGQFAAWISRGADLPESLFTMMQQDQVMHDRPIDHFGLGWRIITVNDTTVLAHDGREQGVRTQVFVIPEQQSGFVFLTNSSNGELLTRQLTQAGMPQGAAILDEMDANVWLFASTIPVKIQPRMLQFVARSPAFVAKLLHGAEIGLVRTHFPGSGQRHEVVQAIDKIAIDLLHKNISSEEILAFFKTMGEADGETFQLSTSMNREQATQWRTNLLALANNDNKNP